MELLIATNKITKPTEANQGVDKQTVLKGFIRSQAVLGKYIRQLSFSGSILPQVDYNWRLILPKNYQFIVKAILCSSLFVETELYVSIYYRRINIVIM